MNRSARCALALCVTLAAAASAQSVSSNVVSADGPVDVVFASRASVCGDGQTFIRASRRGSNNIYTDMDGVYSEGTVRGGEWQQRLCARGPVRVLATVLGGEITRLATFVGPIPATHATRTINASAADASAWLSDLASHAPNRVATQAIRTMMFADAPDPWPLLLRLARAALRRPSG